MAARRFRDPEEMPEGTRRKVSEFLTREEIRDLNERSDLMGFLAVAFTWSVIVATFASSYGPRSSRSGSRSCFSHSDSWCSPDDTWAWPSSITKPLTSPCSTHRC